MLPYFKYYIIKTQQAWKSIVLKLCGYAAAFRPAWCWGGVWSDKWGCRNIIGRDSSLNAPCPRGGGIINQVVNWTLLVASQMPSSNTVSLLLLPVSHRVSYGKIKWRQSIKWRVYDSANVVEILDTRFFYFQWCKEETWKCTYTSPLWKCELQLA